MANNEKKYYTFMDITDGPDGVKNITAELTLTRPENHTTANGKNVLTCAGPFSNQTNALAKALGVELKENDGTVWADVQFWDERAERFQKFLNGRDKVRLIVCGRLSVRTWTTKSGETANRVQISVRNWKEMRTTAAAPTVAPAEDNYVATPDVEQDDMPF